MAGSINKVILVGNVGNVEIRSTQDGRRIANLSLATSETWRDKATGERREKTEWHRIVVFSEGLVNVVEQYIKKGSKLYIEGALQTRKWTDQSGVEKYTTEIVLQGYGSSLTMLDRIGNDSYQSQQQPSYEMAEAPSSGGGPSFGHMPSRPSAGGEDIIDDEIPF